MQIYFMSSSKVIEQYEDIQINNKTSLKKTTKSSVFKGSWYYEVTHREGNSASVSGFYATPQ